MSDSGTTDHTAKLTRIREVAMTVREPKNAGEIADAAGIARNTAEKYLNQLVEADKLTTIQRGRETCYYPDPVTQYFDQIRDLINEQQKDDLTAELDAIRDDIDEWKATYDVESADELRATVGDDIPAAERKQRRHDAEDWDYYEHQAMLIKQAIQLYDTIEATRDTQLTSAN
ncbi:ArsR/SmtB family transcription factor [Haloarcula nitratireducens]|uniref:Winged helix-turn-helix domain-containing protein n=1 Tax=Haloarcula nitratireducens TaxID=2487749 RepID=A0AAW4PFU7_9EURY|nr:winged helix-turn-helix domain-containing protein [Halomicroarcula nitratireducens]MBX0296699.1 winged helix-turn-helix domain-containing protein [Halomicroarcula nitratireducens]